jgi:hypothetical protein
LKLRVKPKADISPLRAFFLPLDLMEKGNLFKFEINLPPLSSFFSTASQLRKNCKREKILLCMEYGCDIPKWSSFLAICPRPFGTAPSYGTAPWWDGEFTQLGTPPSREGASSCGWPIHEVASPMMRSERHKRKTRKINQY